MKAISSLLTDIYLLILCGGLIVCTTVKIQAQPTAENEKDGLYWQYAKRSFPELQELLALPNDAHYLEDLEVNLKWCEGAFAKRGFSTQRLNTEGAPLLLASQVEQKSGAETILIYRQELAADMLVIFDGPRHLSNQPTLTFGARGITEFTLKVFGPRFPQHSGHYGNWAPNPAERLAQLIASMKRPDGTVSIPGFYDGIALSEDVRTTMREVPDDEQRINYELGIAKATQLASTYQESLQYPSLNVKGFLSGWVGAEARNIVPASATAEMDIRLVLENDPERLLGLVRKHIEDQGYFVTDAKPTARERLTHERICQFNSVTSYLAFRTGFDRPVGQWLDRALTKAFGAPPIKQRTSGGSIPISPFVNVLGLPAVSVPLVNSDNNQHAPNENVRLGNYVDGIKTVHAILTEKL